MASRTEAGQEAERQVAAHLARAGLKVVTRNHRCRGGEVDIVCRDGDTLVFVEVRLRRNARFGGALASVTAGKQNRLARAARDYLMRSGWQGPCRFDVVGLAGDGQIDWIRAAFHAG